MGANVQMTVDEGVKNIHSSYRRGLISSHKYDTLADAYRHGVWAGKYGLDADEHPYPDKPYMLREYCRGYAAGMTGKREAGDRDIELREGALTKVRFTVKGVKRFKGFKKKKGK